MKTKTQLEKEIEEKRDYFIGNQKEVLQATLTQTNEIIKLIEPKLNELNKEIEEFEKELTKHPKEEKQVASWIMEKTIQFRDYLEELLTKIKGDGE